MFLFSAYHLLFCPFRWSSIDYLVHLVISIQYPEGNCVTETSCTPLTSKNAAVGCSITEMSTLAVAPPPNLLNVYYKPYS